MTRSAMSCRDRRLRTPAVAWKLWQKRGLPLMEGVDYTNSTYFRHQVARIHLLLGEQDKALDILESLLANPYYLSPGWLRIDPTFKSLKGNPRFEKLLGAR